MIPTENGIYPDIEESQYHRDLSSLSSTGAKLLATHPPEVFRDMLLNGWASKKEFDTGSLVHKLVLGEGPQIEVVDADSWRTKAAQAARDEAREAGRIPALTKDMESAEVIADRVFESHAAHWFSVGAPEVSMYASDPVTGVRMRGRVDWLRDDCLVDFKTSADPSPEGFERSIWKFRYHLQAWWYLNIARANGHAATDFVFVTVGTKRPYSVTTHHLTERYLLHGEHLARRALDTYSLCRETGEWPGYPARMNLVDLPAWANTNYYDDVEDVA